MPATLDVTCPNCGKVLKVPAALEGKRVKCKGCDEAFVIKGGVLSGQRLSPDDVKALADVAPREQLLAELAGLMAAPTQQFVNLLDAIPRDFAYALNALIEKNESAAA